MTIIQRWREDLAKTGSRLLAQLQCDLDRYTIASAPPRAIAPRTPYQAFLDGIEAMRREEVKPEAT